MLENGHNLYIGSESSLAILDTRTSGVVNIMEGLNQVQRWIMHDREELCVLAQEQILMVLDFRYMHARGRAGGSGSGAGGSNKNRLEMGMDEVIVDHCWVDGSSGNRLALLTQ